MYDREPPKTNYMKRYIYILLTMLSFMVGCSKDDNEVSLSSNKLYQTIWEGTLASYGSEDTPKVIQQFVVEFISTTEGKCVLPDFHEIQNFNYSIVDDIMTFQGSDVLCGDWYIISYSDEQIILQAYLPYKTIMTLNKILE